jgi:hypothetical protein
VEDIKEVINVESIKVEDMIDNDKIEDFVKDPSLLWHFKSEEFYIDKNHDEVYTHIKEKKIIIV